MDLERIAAIVFTGGYFFMWLFEHGSTFSVWYTISAIAAAVWCVLLIVGYPRRPVA